MPYRGSKVKKRRGVLKLIHENAAAIGGSETLFAMYDAEEEQTRAESEAR
jgi:hypothetical protein